MTHRQCTIDIHNKTSHWVLGDPCVHLISGTTSSPLPPTLSPSEGGSALFIKTPDTACGSVAVFTYTIIQQYTRQKQGKMAVMFSNPYDFNLYSNWYAIGVFDDNQPCDKNLFNKMYYEEEEGFVRGKPVGPSLTYKKYISIRATMSDSNEAILKLDICDY